jgi:hypothetical protein
MSKELSGDEKITQELALKEIESRKEELIEKFVESQRPLHLDVVSFFMAGSPGAGKTEFSRRFMPAIAEKLSFLLDKKDPKLVKNLLSKGVDIESIDTIFIRIDVDEIREFLSQYQKTDEARGIKGNSHVVQKAAGKGLDIIRDYCFRQHISFLHDGTFGNLETMHKIVKKSLRAGREVQIFYIYSDPLVAWKVTKARECLEGRNIIKDKFIDQFFASRENVDKIKEEFGKEVKVNCVLKNENNDVMDIEFNVSSLDNFFKNKYAKQAVKEYSREDLHNLISEV